MFQVRKKQTNKHPVNPLMALSGLDTMRKKKNKKKKLLFCFYLCIFLHSPTPTARVSPYNADAESDWVVAGDLVGITVPSGCLPPVDTDNMDSRRANGKHTPEKSFTGRGGHYLPPGREVWRRPQRAPAALPVTLIIPLRASFALSGAADAVPGSYSHRKMVLLLSLSFPVTVALSRLHVARRWDGRRTQDRRARPLRGVRGSCCKVLN